MAKSLSNNAGKPVQAGQSGRLMEYAWAALLFFCFLGLLGLVLSQTTFDANDDPLVTGILSEALQFMLMLFGGGFLVVLLLDAAYDYFAQKAETMESEQ